MRFTIHPFRRALPFAAAALVTLLGAGLIAPISYAQEPLEPTGMLPSPVEHRPGGEANLVIPDLSQVTFLGIPGDTLLMFGLIVCAAGLLFGLVIYSQLKKMPVHASMLAISELIYETCKTYLITQGVFILILEVFIGLIILLSFGVLLDFEAVKVATILAFSLIGIAGSYGVAWFGIRVNTFANSRTAFASLKGKPR